MRNWKASIIAISIATTGLAREASAQATYLLTFDATWSQATHPVEFPPGPHFSPLVGATHDGGVSFWSIGAVATSGIERMAETGQTGPLLVEVANAISTGTAFSRVLGTHTNSPGTATATFEVSLDHPLVSVVSMIAPSPDWFVGVRDLNLTDGDGSWLDEVVVALPPYDAGTDSGSTFLSPDDDTDPPESITEITDAPFTGTGPLGTFTFTLLGVGCIDLDGDDHGAPASAECLFPEFDCDDTDPAVNPRAVEIPGNGVDDDCDPATPTGCQPTD